MSRPPAASGRKILIFQAAIERGGLGPWLAVIMLANSVISVVYYFAVPKQMIFEPARDGSRMRSPALVNAVVAFAFVAIVAVFVFPNPIAHAAELSTLIGAEAEVRRP